jgi:hypothetical protein
MFLAWKFVSALPLKSPYCASCTVIHSCVLCGHRAQLHGEFILGCVSRDGGAALEGCAVVSVTIITYLPHRLQPLPRGLTDPGPTVISGNGVTRHSTGEGQDLIGLHQAKSWLLQLYLRQDTWRQGETFNTVTCNHDLPMDSHVTLGTLTFGGCHQAQEKTQQSHVIDHIPALFRYLSPVLRERSCSPSLRFAFNPDTE